MQGQVYATHTQCDEGVGVMARMGADSAEGPNPNPNRDMARIGGRLSRISVRLATARVSSYQGRATARARARTRARARARARTRARVRARVGVRLILDLVQREAKDACHPHHGVVCRDEVMVG